MIVFAHVCALMIGSLVNVQPYSRYATDFRANMRTLLYQPLFNGGLVVHTFFIISGMMMTYHGLSSKRIKFSYLSYVALRWLRYSPVMLASLCMTVALELFGSGPLFHHDHLMINLNSCYDYWWAHLTYIQNILPLECNVSSEMKRLIWSCKTADFVYNSHSATFPVGTWAQRCRSTWSPTFFW